MLIWFYSLSRFIWWLWSWVSVSILALRVVCYLIDSDSIILLLSSNSNFSSFILSSKASICAMCFCFNCATLASWSWLCFSTTLMWLLSSESINCCLDSMVAFNSWMSCLLFVSNCSCFSLAFSCSFYDSICLDSYSYFNWFKFVSRQELWEVRLSIIDCLLSNSNWCSSRSWSTFVLKSLISWSLSLFYFSDLELIYETSFCNS